MIRFSSTPLRMAALLTTAAIAAGALTACSKDDASEADAQKLTILSSFTTGNATGDHLNKLVKDFTTQTGIQVDIEEANTNDIANTYEASKLADEERDLVILNLTPDTSDWLPQGQVVNVKKYLDEWGLTDKIVPEAMKFWTQADADNGVAGFPYTGFNWPVWYNMDLLKKAGVTEVPATVDDLIAASTKLRAANIPPMALGGAEWPVQNFITWMVQQYVKPDEAQTLFSKGGYCASPGAVQGLDLLGKLRDSGVFVDNVQGYTADQMTSAYFNGKAAMMPSGSWSYTEAPPAIAAATQLAGFPLPTGGVYTKPTAFQGHSNGFFLSPNGEKKIASVEKFIKYMYDQPVLQGWVSEGSQIMSVKNDILGSVTSTQPLVVAGNEITPKVDYLLLPDSYIPSGTDYSPAGSEFLGKKGQTGAQFCKTLDKLYKK
jgi:multiple sugar transport system substrate-binding protein